MKRLCIPIAATAAIMLGGCHEAPSYRDDPFGNFDCLWQQVNDHYCFFAEKDIDWAETGARYRALITPETPFTDLYVICANMLDELRDGHVNLITPFATSSYKKWWSDYPQDFSLRTIQENYFDFRYLQTSGVMYGTLEEGRIGYIYYPSFGATVGQGNLDYILAILSETEGLILDIRDNGGGYLTNIDRFVARFIDRDITSGSIRHKTGPGPQDFSDPYPLEYSPAEKGRVQYLGKPIAVLTNRSCYSAANSFAMVMKQLPGVTLIGARTGGGGGLPFSSELPNGWGLRFSACPVYDAQGESIETGIDPTPGFVVTAPAEELAEGRDAILETAIKLLAP